MANNFFPLPINYPVTLLGELKERDKSKQIIESENKIKLTFSFKATLIIPTNDNDMSFQVDNATQVEEGSSGIGNLGNMRQIFKDPNMPDGDVKIFLYN